VCDLENLKNEEAMTLLGRSATANKEKIKVVKHNRGTSLNGDVFTSIS
jgi:hypothetical protein